MDYHLSRYDVHLALSCADMTKPVVAQSLAYITLTSLPALGNPLIEVYARDIKPQERIEEALRCRFVRFNPDNPAFDIGDVINQIMVLMYVPNIKA